MNPSVTYSEAELLDRLKAQDEQGFSYLYDRYSKALFTVIYNVIPQQETAEDVLQEVFLKIWQDIKSYDTSKGRLYTWMLNIARNGAIDRLRSKDFNNQSKTRDIPDSVYSKESGAFGKQTDDVGLMKVIENLPPENRKLLQMAYFHGYTQEEIARILEMPLGTVKTRIRNTVIHLRKLLGTNQ